MPNLLDKASKIIQRYISEKVISDKMLSEKTATEKIASEQIDSYRLNYHIAPKQGLLNDPNGLIEFKGQYHVFYQWNPFACDHKNKFWGHYISDDLIHWSEVQPAIAPDEVYDKNGCYSGSAIEYKNELYLFYTGNVKDEKGNRDSTQCLAKSKDGIHFEKIGVVITGQPQGYTAHFRDPKIWQEDEIFYAVLGAQTENEQGHVLLYRSHDIKHWEYLGPIAGSGLNGIGEFGYMWECPDIFMLEKSHILLASPQGLKAQGIIYQNLYQSGYFVGELDLEEVAYQHNQFQEIDRGFDFYASQTFIDSKNRRIMFAWMGLPENESSPTVNEHWIHAMTLPRELKLIDDKLYQYPVDELQRLRMSSKEYSNIYVSGELKLDGIYGDCYELMAEFDKIEGCSGIKLRSNENDQYLLIEFDPESNILTLDRSRVEHGTESIRQCHLPNTQRLKLQIFMDKSSVEVFINDGAEVMTARLYPETQSQQISFYSHGKCELTQINHYQLKSDNIIR